MYWATVSDEPWASGECKPCMETLGEDAGSPYFGQYPRCLSYACSIMPERKPNGEAHLHQLTDDMIKQIESTEIADRNKDATVPQTVPSTFTLQHLDWTTPRGIFSGPMRWRYANDVDGDPRTALDTVKKWRMRKAMLPLGFRAPPAAPPPFQPQYMNQPKANAPA